MNVILRNLTTEDFVLNIEDYKAVITDFAIANGGMPTKKTKNKEKNNLSSRLGMYWTGIEKENFNISIISPNGIETGQFSKDRMIGIRPVTSAEKILAATNQTEQNITKIECGNYPKSAVSKEMQKELEEKFQNGQMLFTGKTYTRDSRNVYDYQKSFSEETMNEYTYNDEKYVRVKIKSSIEVEPLQLSNGEIYENGKHVWIKVEPITWLLDVENNFAISEEIITAGVQFNFFDKWDEFENTTVQKFLNKNLVKEIFNYSELVKIMDVQNNIKKQAKIRIIGQK